MSGTHFAILALLLTWACFLAWQRFGQDHRSGVSRPPTHLFFHQWKGRSQGLDHSGITAEMLQCHWGMLVRIKWMHLVEEEEEEEEEEEKLLSHCLVIAPGSKPFHFLSEMNSQKGTKAPQAAGRIHTDFEKGFIMAEVMKFEDFKEEGSEAAAKVSRWTNPCKHWRLVSLMQAAGKYRQQGRNYVVEDGDIILFKFNAGSGLTSKDAKKKWLSQSLWSSAWTEWFPLKTWTLTNLRQINCWPDLP